MLGCMYERILVPTDGSEGAEAAAAPALELADRFGATLHVLFVVDTSYPVTWPDTVPPDADEMIAAVERVGDEATASIAERARLRGIPAHREVRRGAHIHRVLLEYLRDHDIDLVVMGTHGRSGLGRVLLGSVTEKLLRTAHVPVLAVPREEAGD